MLGIRRSMFACIISKRFGNTISHSTSMVKSQSQGAIIMSSNTPMSDSLDTLESALLVYQRAAMSVKLIFNASESCSPGICLL